MTTKKKTTAKKAMPVKKKPGSKVTATVKTQAVSANKAVDVKTSAPEQKETKAPVTVKKKVYEISPFFHAMVVLMVAILYVEMAFFAYIYTNYEVTIESKQMVYARQMRAIQQRKAVQLSKRRVMTHRVRGEKSAHAMTAKKALPPVTRQVAFNEAEYAPYAAGGNAVIEGNACFTLSDGSEKCFEGIEVFINPVTSYSDEWYNRGWAGRECLPAADERAFAYNKKVKTGKNGAFKFEKLKSGSYYVGAAVCLPATKDAKVCRSARYASKVTMKNRVKTTLKKVYPSK